MKETTLITIPVGYVAIPIEERDNLIGTINNQQNRIYGLENKIDKIKQLCIEESSRVSVKSNNYYGSLYITDVMNALGIDVEVLDK